jgi:hypothetical protein
VVPPVDMPMVKFSIVSVTALLVTVAKLLSSE